MFTFMNAFIFFSHLQLITAPNQGQLPFILHQPAHNPTSTLTFNGIGCTFNLYFAAKNKYCSLYLKLKTIDCILN